MYIFTIGCQTTLATNLWRSDYNTSQLDLSQSYWKNSTVMLHHPICEMKKKFIIDTITINNVNNENKLFISFDGNGDISELTAYGAVIGSVKPPETLETDSSKSNTTHIHDRHDVDMKFIDLFISINSNFFILNPRSTFSWQIYLIRVCLELESVPVIENTDIYVQNTNDFSDKFHNRKNLWVNFVSIVNVYNEIKNIL